MNAHILVEEAPAAAPSPAAVRDAAPARPLFALPTTVGTTDLMVGQGVDIVVEFRPEGLPGPASSSLSVDFNGAMGVGTIHVLAVRVLEGPQVTLGLPAVGQGQPYSLAVRRTLVTTVAGLASLTLAGTANTTTVVEVFLGELAS